MDIRSKLSDLKSQAFQKIGQAALKGHAEEISRLAAIAKECEQELGMLSNIETSVYRLETALTGAGAPGKQAEVMNRRMTAGAKSAGSLSPRQKGNHARGVYVEQLEQSLGLKLRRVSETVYEMPSGGRLGIPYASELDRLPDRWWLGILDGKYDFVVLLCETAKGEMLDFVFPTEMLNRVWGNLSRDKKRNVKFNLFRRGSSYDLRAKAGLSENVGHLIGNTAILS
jgi:hypothetical protein